MILTLDISPETEARFEAEAASRGKSTDEYVRESLQTWLSLATPETEAEFFTDCRALTLPTLYDKMTPHT